jgi:hypothetical protein
MVEVPEAEDVRTAGVHEAYEASSGFDPHADADTVTTRSGMITRLRLLAQSAEMAGDFGAARAALADLGKLVGLDKEPEVKPTAHLTDEQKREVICKAAERFGMVWPKERRLKPGEPGDFE